jgi:hypothetical protein
MNPDFTIIDTSPCRGNGHPFLSTAVSFPPSIDWQLDPRVINSGDIGADHYYVTADRNGIGYANGSDATLVASGKVIVSGIAALNGADATVTSSGSVHATLTGDLEGTDAVLVGIGELGDISIFIEGIGVFVGTDVVFTATGKVEVGASGTFTSQDAVFAATGEVLVTGIGVFVGADAVLDASGEVTHTDLNSTGTFIGRDAVFEAFGNVLVQIGPTFSGRDAVFTATGEVLITGIAEFIGTDAQIDFVQLNNNVIVKRVITRKTPIVGQLVSP